MITAIIRNKENTLVLELPHSIYDIYEKLQLYRHYAAAETDSADRQ